MNKISKICDIYVRRITKSSVDDSVLAKSGMDGTVLEIKRIVKNNSDFSLMVADSFRSAKKYQKVRVYE